MSTAGKYNFWYFCGPLLVFAVAGVTWGIILFGLFFEFIAAHLNAVLIPSFFAFIIQFAVQMLNFATERSKT